MITPQDASAKAREICQLAPIVPVLVVEDASIAQDLARALVAGGLPALEVTLRTDAALDVGTGRRRRGRTRELRVRAARRERGGRVRRRVQIYR